MVYVCVLILFLLAFQNLTFRDVTLKVIFHHLHWTHLHDFLFAPKFQHQLIQLVFSDDIC